MYELHPAMADMIVVVASIWAVSFFLLLFERWLERYRDQLADMVSDKWR